MKQRVKALFASGLFALALFGVAAAGPLEDGLAAMESRDYATAMRQLGPLAEQGIARAQLNLGLIYFLGLGVPQDYAQAAAWYRKAADQGNAAAQFGLGVMYEDEEGVPQDYAQAHMWYDLAASHAEDPKLRDKATRVRDSLATIMTPAQIAEAQRLASEWKPK
jgi:uncharacterized protein